MDIEYCLGSRLETETREFSVLAKLILLDVHTLVRSDLAVHEYVLDESDEYRAFYASNDDTMLVGFIKRESISELPITLFDLTVSAEMSFMVKLDELLRKRKER